MNPSNVSLVHRLALILASLCLWLAGPASAADIKLSGTCSWETTDSTINIVAGKVENATSGGSSGSLRLQLWATAFPYSSGGISGYVLGTRALGTLQGGYSYNNISGSVTYTSPPSGIYYTTMTVEEYNGSSYVIRDHRTFSGTSDFGTGGGGGGGGDGSLEIEGSGTWSISGASINISADKISNNRTGGSSGSLRLQIWATSSPYSGGTLTGYSIGTRNLEALDGGYYYSNVSGDVPYEAPPDGIYYTVMTLEEYDSGGFAIADYLTFSGTSTFGSGGGEDTGTIDITGSSKYQISGRRINLKVTKLSNTRSVGTSGTLRLRLWATKSRFNGKSLKGRVVATRDLGQLGANRYFSNIAGKVTFSPPPRGNYYMTLVVEEYTDDGYVIRDYARFSSKYRSR